MTRESTRNPDRIPQTSRLWTDPAPPGKGTESGHDRRARATRSAILTAARHMFVRHGTRVSIDEIVQAAGVAKGSFYNHFATKDELFDKVIHGTMAALNERIRDAVSGIEDPTALIAAGIRCGVRTLLADREACQLLVHSGPTTAGGGFADRALREDSLDAISAGIAAGAFRPINVDVLYAAYFGAIHGAIEQLFLRREPIDPEEAAELVLALAFGVLGVPPDNELPR